MHLDRKRIFFWASNVPSRPLENSSWRRINRWLCFPCHWLFVFEICQRQGGLSSFPSKMHTPTIRLCIFMEVTNTANILQYCYLAEPSKIFYIFFQLILRDISFSVIAGPFVLSYSALTISYPSFLMIYLCSIWSATMNGIKSARTFHNNLIIATTSALFIRNYGSRNKHQ